MLTLKGGEGGIEELENIQHRITRLVPCLTFFKYAETKKAKDYDSRKLGGKGAAGIIQFSKIVYGHGHFK